MFAQFENLGNRKVSVRESRFLGYRLEGTWHHDDLTVKTERLHLCAVLLKRLFFRDLSFFFFFTPPLCPVSRGEWDALQVENAWQTCRAPLADGKYGAISNLVVFVYIAIAALFFFFFFPSLELIQCTVVPWLTGAPIYAQLEKKQNKRRRQLPMHFFPPCKYKMNDLARSREKTHTRLNARWTDNRDWIPNVSVASSLSYVIIW